MFYQGQATRTHVACDHQNRTQQWHTQMGILSLRVREKRRCKNPMPLKLQFRIFSRFRQNIFFMPSSAQITHKKVPRRRPHPASRQQQCRQALCRQGRATRLAPVLPHQRRRRRAKRSVNFFKGDLKIRQKGTFLPLYTYPSHPLLIDLLISLMLQSSKNQCGDRRIIQGILGPQRGVVLNDFQVLNHIFGISK